MKRLLVTVYSVFLLAATSSVFGGNASDYPGPGYVPDPYAAEHPAHDYAVPPAHPMHGPYSYSAPPRIHVEKAMYQDGYLVRVYTRGITPEDIEVAADRGQLRLRSEMSRQKWRSAEPYRISSTFSRGSIRRTIRLPYDADASKLTTSVVQGVLEIRIPWLQLP